MNKEELIMSRVSVEKLQETFKEISLKAKNEFKDLIKNFKGEDIKINIVLHEGKASTEIINISNKVKPDIIIMGSNGKDSIGDYLLGTTTDYVVDNSKYPVLVIPNV